VAGISVKPFAVDDSISLDPYGEVPVYKADLGDNQLLPNPNYPQRLAYRCNIASIAELSSDL
jgi:hypothetical protein